MLCKESGQNLCDSYIEMNLSLKETKNNYGISWIMYEIRSGYTWDELKQQGLDSSIKEVWCKIWQTKIAALNT